MTDSKKILIVDDDPVIMELLETRLKSAGYSVVKADNGLDAGRLVKEELPNLVVLDVMMPGMDGYTLAKQIKMDEDTKNIPIIILTARGKLKDIFEAEGIEDYLEKPFDANRLLEKIRSYFSKAPKI